MFYWAKMYTADFKSGEAYSSLHKCITINIIADGFKLNDAIHSEYLLQEKTAHTVLTDVLEVHFLDLQFKNIRPCIFLNCKFASKLGTAWNHRHPWRY